MDTKIKQFGLIQEKELKPQDNFFGVATLLEPKMIQPDMDWTPFLGKFEPQSNKLFDSMGCVSFSLENVIAARINKMIHEGEMSSNVYERLKELGFIDELNDFNASERGLAKLSGTTNRGNRLSAVADTVANMGLVPDRDWDFNTSEIKSFEEFYKMLPSELIEKSRKFLDLFNFGWEWVGTSEEMLKMALKTSPIQVTVQVGCPQNGKGFYVNHDGSYIHAITLAAHKDHYVGFDHYSGNIFKKYDLSYKFGHALRVFLELKQPNMTSPNPLGLSDNTKVFVNTGKRIFKALFIGFHNNEALKNKMVLDDPQLINDQWEARNAKDGYFDGGAIKNISEEDFNKYNKCNFKGQPLN